MKKLGRFLDILWSLFYYLIVCYFVDRSRRVAFVNAVRTFQRRQKDSSSFQTVELSALLPGIGSMDVHLENFVYRSGNVSFGELCVIAAVSRYLEPATVFEIGTGDGNTTLQIALNTSRSCTIYTLDLPEHSAQTKLKADEGDREFVGKLEVGERFVGHKVAKKIRQIRADSALVDVSELRHKVDMVFIDGSHSVEYVRHDTETAFDMLSPGGVIVWHDFLVWNGVTDVLYELSKTVRLYHVAGTSLVLYKNKGQISLHNPPSPRPSNS